MTPERPLPDYVTEVSERTDVRTGVPLLRNRTGDVWHVSLKGIAPGQLYAYRVDQQALCLMFNASKDGVDFPLPRMHSQARWYVAADTAQMKSQDLFAAGEEPLLEDHRGYRLRAQSSAILLLRGAALQLDQTVFEDAT